MQKSVETSWGTAPQQGSRTHRRVRETQRKECGRTKVQELFESLVNCSSCRLLPGPAESKEELKTLLMEVKEESEKNLGLKLNIQKMKIMASSPITSLLTP